MKNTKKSIIMIITFTALTCLLCSCGGGSNKKSDKYSGYSDSYKNDSDYRNNVDYIAGVYGEDSSRVDSIINSLADNMK